jgi:hypothetical protein
MARVALPRPSGARGDALRRPRLAVGLFQPGPNPLSVPPKDVPGLAAKSFGNAEEIGYLSVVTEGLTKRITYCHPNSDPIHKKRQQIDALAEWWAENRWGLFARRREVACLLYSFQ